MPRHSKRPRLTTESEFQAQSEICAPIADEEELKETSSNSSWSVTCYHLSSISSSPLSTPVIPDMSDDKGEEEKEQQEVQEEYEGEEDVDEEEELHEQEVQEDENEEEEQKDDKEEEVEKEEEEEKTEDVEEEEGEEWEQPAAETSSPPQSPQGSSVDSSSQGNEGTSCLQISADPRSLPRDPLGEEVANLVHFMVHKYRLRKSVTKAEMLKVVKEESQFPVIFKKACKFLEVISGIDVKEVVPATHSYVLVNSLDLTYDEVLSDPQSIPKNGLLIVILGMIFLEGNCASEEDMWGFLNMLGVYAGREHFIYGEPRKLITRTWVQENYLEYQQVPSSDPPRYKFMWGPRAHAETSKLQVLEFLAKIKGTDPISFSCWYEEALRDEQERAQARTGPVGRAAAAAVFMELQ